MTKQELLATVKENLKESFDDSSEYNNRKKLKESSYYVQCVVNEIGKVAFFNDDNLTTVIEKELVENFFN